MMKQTLMIMACAVLLIVQRSTADAVIYSGRVINEIGRPVDEATVTVRSETDPPVELTAVTDTTGTFTFDIPTSVEDIRAVPFQIYGNYPNPFNPATRISYSLDAASDVFITIYNILGQRVRAIDHGYRVPGFHTAVWDGHNDMGMSCSAGVYLYRLEAGGRVLTSRMVMVDAGTGSWISPGATPKAAFKQAEFEPLYTVVVSHDEARVPLVVGPMSMNSTENAVLAIERDLSVMKLVHENEYVRGYERYNYTRNIHPVLITHDFYMDKYETSTAQFCEVMNHALDRGAIALDGQLVKNTEGEQRTLFKVDTPEGEDAGTRLIWRDGNFVADDGSARFPISHVSWYGAMFYCYERSIMEDMSQAIDITCWSVDWDSTGYRLPTDAEWELAAAWTDRREYAYGPDPGYWYPMNTMLNNDGFEDTTSPVGWFSPQGDSHDHISDLSGNLQEWVYDWMEYYHESWMDSLLVDPTGPETGVAKICRGGSAYGCFRGARVGDKSSQHPEGTSRINGFRTIRLAGD